MQLINPSDLCLINLPDNIKPVAQRESEILAAKTSAIKFADNISNGKTNSDSSI